MANDELSNWGGKKANNNPNTNHHDFSKQRSFVAVKWKPFVTCNYCMKLG